eukprot:10096302-Karenia_brevis.AAC.1
MTGEQRRKKKKKKKKKRKEITFSCHHGKNNRSAGCSHELANYGDYAERDAPNHFFMGNDIAKFTDVHTTFTGM